MNCEETPLIVEVVEWILLGGYTIAILAIIALLFVVITKGIQG